MPLSDSSVGIDVDVWKLRRKHTNEDGYSTQIKFAKIQEAKKKKAQVRIISHFVNPVGIGYELSNTAHIDKVPVNSGIRHVLYHPYH